MFSHTKFQINWTIVKIYLQCVQGYWSRAPTTRIKQIYIKKTSIGPSKNTDEKEKKKNVKDNAKSLCVTYRRNRYQNVCVYVILLH